MQNKRVASCSILLNSVGGVDIFFYISALGLCLSFGKDPIILNFYKRRIKRILPTWFPVLIGMHILNLYFGNDCPHSFFEALLYYTGIGWWIHCMFECGNSVYYEWYIPTLLVFYFFFPYLAKLKTKILLGLLLFSVCSTLFLSSNGILDSLKLTHQRIPVFLFGIISYRYLVKDDIPKYMRALETIGFLIGGLIFIYAIKLMEYESIYELCMERIAILLAMPVFLYLITLAIKHTRTTKLFSLFGKYSLELYLLHLVLLYNVSLKISALIDLPPLSLILSIILFLIISLAYNKVVTYTYNKFL